MPICRCAIVVATSVGLSLGVLAAGCSKSDSSREKKVSARPGEAPRGLPAAEAGHLTGSQGPAVNPGALPPATEASAELPEGHPTIEGQGPGELPEGHPTIGGQGPGSPTAPAGPPFELNGAIDVTDEFRAKIPEGATVFVSARSRRTLSLLGAARLKAGTWPLPFVIDNKSAMAGLAPNDGDKVLITVVVDRDGDPITKQGEIEGLLEVTWPQKQISLKLDHIREAP